MDKYILLSIMIIVSIISKNKGLLYASILITLLTFLPYQEKTLGYIRNKGMNAGIFILTLAILAPIALGQISLNNLIEIFTGYKGVVAVAVGIITSILATKGITLQTMSPNIVVAISIGSVMGIALFGGTATGPIIASGLTYFFINLISK